VPLIWVIIYLMQQSQTLLFKLNAFAPCHPIHYPNSSPPTDSTGTGVEVGIILYDIIIMVHGSRFGGDVAWLPSSLM